MLDLNNLTQAQYRARYESLQAQARARAATPNPVAEFGGIPVSAIILSDTLPPGAYGYFALPRGAALRITNLSGTPGAALFLWNADDPSERYNAGDTTKLQWTTRLTIGRVLFSDMGRILASIIADTGSGHDTIIGPNTPAQTASANGRDNIRNAAAKFGLSRRDVAPAISLFSPVAVNADGCRRWQANPPAGAQVEFRAEMNLLVVLSNTPHALSPEQTASGPIDYTAWRAPTASANDLCRHFTQEAERGFTNTDKVFAL
jgi:urea carboxylase-associated protein 2